MFNMYRIQTVDQGVTSEKTRNHRIVVLPSSVYTENTDNTYNTDNKDNPDDTEKTENTENTDNNDNTDNTL